ncbi:MAG: TetR/AcrR family transcriptional regulator [Bryobacteraceae bacterium]
MDLPTTKDRILDAAERLFGDRGFTDTSLRTITAEAGANLAAVNYHFQSKDALIQAVFARRLGPLNQQRMAMLDACEARAGDGPLPIEDVLRAFLEPVLKIGHERASTFGRLLGRMYIDPGDIFERIFREQFSAAKVRFLGAFRRALPELPPEEMFWRLHFVIGALAHTMAGLHHLKVTSEGLCDASDLETTLNRLIAFLAAGFRTPAPNLPNRDRQGAAPQGDPQCNAN